MKWNRLSDKEQFLDLLAKSVESTQVIYKHSYACGISTVTKYRLEKNAPPEGVEFYFLDVLADRPLSRWIAKELNVPHESPQLLIIKNRQCIFDSSHLSINMSDVMARAA